MDSRLTVSDSGGPAKLPFSMVAAVPEYGREAHMHYAIRCANEARIPRLRAYPMGDGVLSIACYGPSLADTWQDIPRPILSVSGAHDFLIERGVVPDYHAAMDPRADQLPTLSRPHRKVRYLLASVCHPLTWRRMAGYDVTLWHARSGKNTEEFLSVFDPGEIMLNGGSSVGLSAIHLGGLLGYRKFRIFGMDGSYKDGKRHAGPHWGHKQKKVKWTASGREWETSTIMQNSNQEMVNMLYMFPIFCVFYGDGLLQDMVREHSLLNNAALADDPAKCARVLGSRYIELMECAEAA